MTRSEPIGPLLAGAAVGGAVAARMDPSSFAGYLAVVGAAAAFALVFPHGRLQAAAAALAAVGFPLLVSRGAEEGLMWAAAGAFILLSSAAVARGRQAGALVSLSHALLAVVYLGGLGTYLVLIRQLRAGGRLLVALAVMVALFELLRAALDGRLRSRGGPGPLGDPRALAAGVAGSAAAGAGLSALLSLPMGPPEGAVLGVMVGLLAALGRAATHFALGEHPGLRPNDLRALGWLSGLLLAAPGLYYGLRLYLS